MASYIKAGRRHFEPKRDLDENSGEFGEFMLKNISNNKLLVNLQFEKIFSVVECSIGNFFQAVSIQISVKFGFNEEKKSSKQLERRDLHLK